MKKRLGALLAAAATAMTTTVLVAMPAAHAASTVPPGGLQPITPARFLETRDGDDAVTVDGLHQNIGRLRAGSTTEIAVAGRYTIPADTTLVAATFTAVAPDGDGYLTAYPCGDQPHASSLNYSGPSGRATASTAIVGLSPTGSLCVYTHADVDLTIDITARATPPEDTTAAEAPDAALIGVNPTRLLDTRSGANFETADGNFAGAGRVTAGDTIEIDVAGRAGIPADATLVAANVAAISPDQPGHATVFPCGDMPLTSTLNYHGPSPAAVNNMSVVGLSPNGTLCIHTHGTADYILDVTAYSTQPDAIAAPAPLRLFDSRTGDDIATVDGNDQHLGRRGAGQVTEIQIAGRAGVADDATTAVLNVTAVSPSSGGHVTVYSCGDQPHTSNLNHGGVESAPIANTSIVGLSPTGTVCVYTHAEVDIVVDLTAYHTAPTPPDAVVEPDGTMRCVEPGDDWSSITPAQAGMDAEILQAAIDAAKINSGFAIRVYRRGCLVGADRAADVSELAQYESWSMAKSIVSMVFGRAWTMGYIDPEDTLGAYFPEADEEHAAITLRQLLEQSSGLDLNAVRDYNIATPDRIETALNTPITAEPGTTFGYSQHGPALVAEAVSRAVSGDYVDFQDFAHHELFGPIGLERSEWFWRRDCPTIDIDNLLAIVATDPELLLSGDSCALGAIGEGNGHTQGFFGLNTHPSEFARFGELMRRDGVWNGERLLSEEYFAEALSTTPTSGCHGWLIWHNIGAPCASPSGVSDDRLWANLPDDGYAFNGLLGQHVAIFPSQEIVVVRVGVEGVAGPLVHELGITDSEGTEVDLYEGVLASITDTEIPPPTPPVDTPGASTGRTAFSPDELLAILTDPYNTFAPMLIDGP